MRESTKLFQKNVTCSVPVLANDTKPFLVRIQISEVGGVRPEESQSGHFKHQQKITCASHIVLSRQFSIIFSRLDHTFIYSPSDTSDDMANSKVAAHTLRSQNKAELLKQLEEFKQELASLRVQKLQGNTKVTKIHDVRKNIARVLTVINQSQREAVREAYKGKKTPLDLRAKQTRAIRRKLTKHEATKITEVSNPSFLCYSYSCV